MRRVLSWCGKHLRVNKLFVFLFMSGMFLLLAPAFILALLFSPAGSFFDKKEATQKGVLAEDTEEKGLLGELSFNIPATFNERVFIDNAASISGSLSVGDTVTIDGDVIVNNHNLTLGTGELTASNVIYSLTAGDNITITGGQNAVISADFIPTTLQGESGDLVLVEGSGITIDGLEIINSDPGSAQDIFKTIDVDGTTFSASGNTDTLTFTAGSGVTLSADTSGKEITIAASGGSGGSSQWTTSGSNIYYNLGNVGIGNTSPGTTLDVTGTGRFSGAFTLSSLSTGILHSNSSGLLSSSAINLAGGSSEVTGTLPAGNGGTGIDTSASTGVPTISSGTWSVSSTLSPGLGGTGVNGSSASNGQLLIGNGSGYTLANLTAGSGISITNGSGSISIAASAGSGSNWTQANGTLSPNNNTLDVLVGGSATTSAKFGVLNVNSGTPTASLSAGTAGGAYLTAAGTLQTTANQTLTLGGSSTGNISLNPQNGSGRIILNTGSLTMNGSTGSTSVSPTCVSVTNGIVTGTGDCGPGEGGSVWTLNATDGTLYPINSTLDVLFGGTATSSAKFAFKNIAGGTPTASISANSGNNAAYLTGDGTLATTNRGTLTIGNSSSYNTTGNVLINPNGTGYVGIGKTNPSYALDVTGAINTTGTGASLRLNAQDLSGNSVVLYSASGELTTYAGLNVRQILTASGRLGLGLNNSSPQGTLDVQGTSVNGGTVPIASFSGTTSMAGIIIDNNGVGDIFTASKSGATKLTLTNAGNLNLASGNAYQIGGTSVLSSTTLGSGVTASSLTSVGTLTSGTWNATAIGAQYGGTGINTSASTGVPSISGGTWSVNAQLPLSLGGTNANLTAVNGGIVYSGASALAISAAGNSGQCLLSGGAGAPTWGDCTTGGGTNFWNQTNGALSPINSTVDLLVGGQASSSAKFAILNMNSGTPTASLSAGATGGAYLTAAGTLQTTANQTLNIGGNTTGNIILNPLNGNGGVGIGISDPGAPLHVNRNSSDTSSVLTNFIVSRQTSGTAANGIGAQQLFQIENSAGTMINAASVNSQLSLATAGSEQGTLYFETSNAGTLAERMRIDYRGNVGINTTSPLATLDTRGTSATTPAASVSAQSNFAAMVVDNRGNGDIFTASSSGLNRFVVKQSGNVGIGTTLPQQKLDIVGNILIRDAETQTKAYRLRTSGSSLDFEGAGQSLYFSNWSGADFTGTQRTYLVLEEGSNTAQALNSWQWKTSAFGTTRHTIDGTTGTNVIFNDNAEGTDFTIEGDTDTSLFFVDGSTDRVGIGQGTPLAKLDVNGDIYLSSGLSTFRTAVSDGTIEATQFCTGDGETNCVTSFANITNQWSVTNGALYPNNSTLDLLIGGQATTSAKFAVLNMNSGTPTASVSAGTAGGAYLTATGTLATTANQTLTLGTSTTTGNIRLTSNATTGQIDNTIGSLGLFTVGSPSEEFMRIDANGFVGINLGIPDATFDVVPQSGTKAIGRFIGPTSYAALVANNTGGGDIFTASKSGTTRFVISNDGNVGIGTTLPGAKIDITRADTTTAQNLRFSTTSGADWLIGQPTSTSDLRIWNDNINTEFFNLTTGGRFGFWTTSPIAALDLRGGGGTGTNNGTVPVASISGQTSSASLVIDNRGTGDLFTASSGGLTRFVIQQNGNVGIHTSTPQTSLDVSGTSNFVNNMFMNQTDGGYWLDAYNQFTTGLVRNVTGDLSLRTNSLERLTVLNSNGSVGIGTQTPLAGLDVRGALGTVAVASVSGTSSFAALVANNNGVGDLFTASKSGKTHFVINNAGKVGIGTALPGARLTVQAENTSLNDQNGFRLVSPDGTRNVSLGWDGANLVWNSSGQDMAFYSNDAAGEVDFLSPINLNGGQIRDTQTATAAATVLNQDSGTNADGLIVKLLTSSGSFGTGCNTSGGACNEYVTFLDGNGRKMGKIYANNSAPTITYKANGLDYAEFFPVDTTFLPNNFTQEDLDNAFPKGMLVCEAARGAVPCTSNNHKKVLGPVSSAPSFVGGEEGPDKILVAISGQVPTFVTTENGAIKRGDLLTFSQTKDGSVMKATKAGIIVGKALQDYTGPEAGKVEMFINLTWYDPDVYLTDSGDLNIAEDAGSFSIKNNTGQSIQRIGAFSEGAIGMLKAGTIDTKNLNISGNLDVQSLSVAGQNMNTTIANLQSSVSQVATLPAKMNSLEEKVLSLSNKIASLEASMLLTTETPESFTASTAGELSLEKLEAKNVNISGTMNVLGRTTVNDLGITGTLTTGILTINGIDDEGNATINTLGGDLKLQNQQAGGIDILAGKVKIERNGNVTIKEKLTAKVVETTKLNITEDPTATQSSILSASAGIAIIPAGKSSLEITTTALTEDSLIFATPDEPVSIGTKAKDDDTFIIKLQSATLSDLRVKWWIVN